MYVQAPGGTVAPRAWSGWRAGSQFEERRKKLGEQEVGSRRRVAKDSRYGADLSCSDAQRTCLRYWTADWAQSLTSSATSGSINDDWVGRADARPSSADLRLFANLSLILDPALPNSLLPAFIQSTYPALVAHYDRLKWSLFGPDSWSIVPVVPPKTASSIWADLPSFSPLSWLGLSSNTGSDSAGGAQGEKSAAPKRETAAEKAFKRGRWMWYAGALGAMVVYVFGSGLVKIEFGAEDEDDEDETAGGWTEVGSEGRDAAVEVVVVDDEMGAI